MESIFRNKNWSGKTKNDRWVYCWVLQSGVCGLLRSASMAPLDKLGRLLCVQICFEEPDWLQAGIDKDKRDKPAIITRAQY